MVLNEATSTDKSLSLTLYFYAKLFSVISLDASIMVFVMFLPPKASNYSFVLEFKILMNTFTILGLPSLFHGSGGQHTFILHNYKLPPLLCNSDIYLDRYHVLILLYDIPTTSLFNNCTTSI